MYAIQVFYIDFDGHADLFFVLTFAAVGVGLLVDDIELRDGKAISTGIAMIVVISILGLGGFGGITNPVNSDSENSLLHSSIESLQSGLGLEGREGPSGDGSSDILNAESNMTLIYWNKIKPESCHYRLSGTELDWIERTNRSVEAETCGQIP